MAINLETKYPGKTAPSDANYPFGAARNITIPGDGTGTPWEAAIVNDNVGFQQAILTSAGIVPSGAPDKVGQSQYLEALNRTHLLAAPTLASALDRNDLYEGLELQIAERTAGDGGGGRWKVALTVNVTPNTVNIVIATEDPLFSLVLQNENGSTVNVRQLGVHPGGADGAATIQVLLDLGGKAFFFPKADDGTKYTLSSLSCGPGVWFLSNGAELIQPVVPNFTRMFQTFTVGYTGVVDSDPLVIWGFILNGNRANQGPYLSFEKEQSSLVFLSTGVPTQPGLFRAIIDNCTFKECTADGVTVHRGVNLTISNCDFDNLFRGSLTVVGGGSRVVGTNLKGYGTVHPSAHQIEIDSTGFDGTESSFVNVSNSQFAGGFDVAVTSPVSGTVSEWYYSNCSFGTEDAQPFNVNGDGMAKLNCVNCEFGVGTVGSRILKPGLSKFSNCTFRFNSNIDMPSLIQPGSSGTTSGNRLNFENCALTYDDSFAPDPAVVISGAAISGNELTIDTSSAHGLSTGDFVFIDRVDPDEFYSGSFLVTATPSTNPVPGTGSEGLRGPGGIFVHCG